MLGGIRAEPSGPLFPLSRRIDTWRATGAALPPLGRGLFIDPAYYLRALCLRSRERMRVRACLHAFARGYHRLSARLGFLELRGIYLA